MSGSTWQFWAWPCQIHVHDCLARSNIWSHATFCQVTKTISFGRWPPDFNLGRLRIFRGVRRDCERANRGCLILLDYFRPWTLSMAVSPKYQEPNPKQRIEY